LIALLHPGVIVRADAAASPTGVPVALRGSNTVAGQARMFARQAANARPGRADEAPAILVEAGGRLIRVLSFTITGDTISAIDIIADPTQLARLRIDSL